MPNATGRAEDEWTGANLGSAFGLALDDEPAPNIYVTTAPIYFTTELADGRVSRIDGTTGAITRLATLPNAVADGLQVLPSSHPETRSARIRCRRDAPWLLAKAFEEGAETPAPGE